VHSLDRWQNIAKYYETFLSAIQGAGGVVPRKAAEHTATELKRGVLAILNTMAWNKFK
jgi:hypothetical protein